MIHLGDITKINGSEIPAVDCVIGGSPCQSFSTAKTGRNGLAGVSGLFMEFVRVVKEMRSENENKPRYLVLENVPGILSSPGDKRSGEDFQVVLTEIIRIVEPNAPIVPMPDQGGGPNQDVSTMKWESSPLLGEYTTRSFGEQPREENVSRLSQILEECPLPKYSLSAKCCKGILKRAKTKGKELPASLEEVLLRQANQS